MGLLLTHRDAITQTAKYLYEVGGVTETDDTIRYQSSWQGHKEKGEYFCACCGGKMVTTWSKEESHWGRVKKVRSSHCLACKPKEDSGSSNVEDDGLGDFPF